MHYQHNHRLLFGFAAVILIVAGCAPQIQKPTELRPAKKTTAEALSILISRSKNTVPLKANGRCRLLYYAEEKLRKENFTVKIWASPPTDIYLQGDVAFDPQGLVAGSNESEFWLAIKPKKISSYWWGHWAQESWPQKLMISPKILLEALGIAQIGSEGNWSLSNEGAFDVLTKRNKQGIIVKKIYILNSRDYPVRKIEYFDTNGQAAVVAELDKHKEVLKEFFVPAIIKITNRTQNSKNDSAEITLSSIKSTDFTDKQRRRLFTRPQPQGFKHIYKIVDSQFVEQPQ